MNKDNPVIRHALGVALVGLAAAAIYMSWGALYEFALACGFPPERAVVFPAIIDVVTIVAMLVALQIKPAGKLELLYPWAALILFGTFTVIGNAMHVVSTPPGELKVALWVAVAANAMPAVALLVTTHLAAVTVYRRKAESGPLAAVPVDRATKRPMVLELFAAGRSARDIAAETGVSKSTVDRWTKQIAVSA